MKSINDYTEKEFLEFVHKIFNVDGTTEKEDVANVLEFKRLTEHPDGSDLIYYPPDDREDSPEGVVQAVKEWRKSKGLPLFKDSK
ncbi:bacteriocin immunity protein [Lonsdalea iberica]|uniref:Colicin immunity protein n=1 Tax=Lonsdalea iberica TaxID=1082703 RepID=A0A1X3RX87_9GAMM|nr:bacteriocin immunity protein [Lonsdalea iberica]OSN06472.1 colicin immunity protein [Lonsdalea iberica]